MLKKIAMLFGVVFVLIGVLGFVPGVTTLNNEGMELLFGVFMVGGVHSAMHVASGVVGLLATGSERYAKWYLQIFGLVYAVLAGIGFVQGDTILGLFGVNLADNLLHTVLAIGLLGAGFGVRASHQEPATPKRAM